MGAIYAMRRMAVTWKNSPPYPTWKSYAPSIQEYVDDLQKAEDKLPKGKTLAVWYKENAPVLRKAPCMRAKNRIVANSLLGLFEANPGDWAAIGYLNSGKPASGSFQDYLSNWYRPDARQAQEDCGKHHQDVRVEGSFASSGEVGVALRRRAEVWSILITSTVR